MNQPQTSTRRAFAEMAQRLRNRNQRYLEFLKRSGDPDDMRSRVLAEVIDGAADGMIVLDEKFAIVLANGAAANLARWELEDTTRDELHSQYQFFIDEGRTPLPHDQEPIVVAAREKRPHELVAYVVSKHLPAPGRWVRAHAAPLFDDQDQLLGGVTIFTDMTEKMRLQRQRDCLAALITHDIKNHLVAEQMVFEELVESENFSDDDLKMLGDLKNASENFRRIADSLLDLFHVDLFGDKHAAQIIDLVPLVKNAVDMSALEASKREVRVDEQFADEQTLVRALPKVMSHVFHNLIQNAVAASRTGGVVSISVSSTPETVAVKNTDQGAGISEEDVSLLFTPPGTAGKVSRTVRPSGFGLYLSHMLVEGQGGTINCASQPDEGTTLTVVMPGVEHHGRA